MSAPPDFSIVVPTFRRPQQLARCLAAIGQLAVDGPTFELLVVDDGGDEGGPRELLAVVPNAMRRELLRQSHAGPGAARNAGARAARGRWLAFTDDDCEPQPGWLAGFGAVFTARPAVCLGGRTREGAATGVLGRAHEILIDYVCRSPAPARSPPFFPSNNLAVPRDGFLALNGFDESFPFAAGEDRDFCARWMAAGGELVAAGEAWVDHRHACGLDGFLRMHYRYGRGAYRFHREQARREGRPVRIEPWSYYLGLIRMPFALPGTARAGRLAGALLLSQLAHALGFARERLSMGTRASVEAP